MTPARSSEPTAGGVAMARPLEPGAISMEQAVGYAAIDCRHGTSVADRLVLKQNRLFLLTDPRGDVAPPGHCGLGLFHDDTRVLSHYELHVTGGPPSLLSSQANRMYDAQIDLAVSDAAFGGDAWNVVNAVHLRREMVIDSALTERVTLTNYLMRPIAYRVELTVASDFADIFEVRGWARARRGTFYAPTVTREAIAFRYRGVDGALLGVRICFAAPPDEIGPHGAAWQLELLPHQPRQLEWRVLPQDPVAGRDRAGDAPCNAGVVSLERLRQPLAEHYARWRADCTQFTTDVEEFDAALDQAVSDLGALYVESGGMQVLSAGIPWYSTAFGRDSIITSLQTLPLQPRIARDTLRFLSRYQGQRENPDTEEQPGKVMHEIRHGEMARAREIPHVPYYGTIDATPLFLILLHETWRWTGDDALVRELMPNALRALEWLERYGDIDGDGLIEYAKTSPKGLVNQGWKDSWDGVPFPDGTLPVPPVALVEVQGYAYDAKRRMAVLCQAFGDPARAALLREQAESLRREIIARFWMEEEGTFALALDGEKRPLRTVTSNGGHLLWTRVAEPEQARRMAARFMQSDMFSGWGLRTLSAAHPVYNPMSYHNGSVWPHDNAIVALGFALYDEAEAMMPVFSALHDAAAGLPYHRLPELFCGMPRAEGRHPVLYPVSCNPQAWASGTPFMLIQAATGLFPDAAARVLHIREPVLPPFLRELSVSGLRIGHSQVSLHFTRHGDRTLANLLDVSGEPLRVRIDLS